MIKLLRKIFIDPIEFLPLFVVYGLFRVLPLKWASGLGGALASWGGPLLPAHQVGQKNLKLAFPKWSEVKRETVLKEAWRNLGRVVGEFPHLKKIAKKYVEIQDLCGLDVIESEDCPVVFFSAHMANWEIPHLVLTLRGRKISLLSRPPNNWLTRWFFKKVRYDPAVSIILKGPEGGKDFLRTLQEKRNMGILLDQRLSEGEKLTFFGHPAYTPVGPARLAQKFNALLIPVQVERTQGVEFRITYHKPLKAGKDFLETSQQINDTFERWITARPDQWLWFHNRWKI